MFQQGSSFTSNNHFVATKTFVTYYTCHAIKQKEKHKELIEKLIKLSNYHKQKDKTT